MSAITTTSTASKTSRPTPQSRELGDLISTIRNALEPTALGKFSISARQAPAGLERELLAGRLAELDRSMSAARPGEISQRVGQMFLRFPSSRLTDATAAATVSAYVHDLRAFPVWALDEAIGGVIRKGNAFAPSSAELVAACGGVVARYRAEAADIRVILSAEVGEATESREAMKQRFSDLLAGLKDSAPQETRTTWRQPTRAEAQDWLEREREGPRPLPKLSPALRAAMGLPEPPERDEDAA